MFNLYELFTVFTAGFSFLILFLKIAHCLCFRSRITINSNPNRNSNIFTLSDEQKEFDDIESIGNNERKFEIEGFTNINFNEQKPQEIHIDVVNHPQ
jgi:hypothetical protein